MLRLLVPAGWMPVAQGGAVVVTICTGQGAVPILLDGSGKRFDPGKMPPAHSSDGQHCPYAALGQSAVPPADAVIPLAWAADRDRAVLTATAWRLGAHRQHAPPSTGPPNII